MSSCNPENVIGNLTGIRDVQGKPTDLNTVVNLKPEEAVTYNNVINNEGINVLENSVNGNDSSIKQKADKEVKEQVLKWGKDLTGPVSRILTDTRNPSGVLGSDVVQPIVDFVTEHYGLHREDLQAGRSAYMAGIKKAFERVEDKVPPKLQNYFNSYKRFYESGGELYGNESSNHGITQAVGNLAGNVIKSSPNVLIGNVLEATVKLPTLYPKTFMQGLGEAVQNGLWSKVPEIDAKGLYGIDHAGESHGKWEGIQGLTDIPLKNIAYFAGKNLDGNGAHAVQKVAFVNRFGDTPAIQRDGLGRASSRFLNYTVNSYKMYAGLWNEARKGNVAPLMTYHVMTALIGGMASGIPAPVEAFVKTAFPESEQWFEENKNAIANLIQPGDISKIGIGFDMANRQWEKMSEVAKQAKEKWEEGDEQGAMLDMADTLLYAASFTKNPLGDFAVQKALRIGKQVYQGDLAPEDIPDEAYHKYLPQVAKYTDNM